MGHRQLSELVTGDETWVHFFQPERKIKNQVKIGKNMRRPTIARSSDDKKGVVRNFFQCKRNCHYSVSCSTRTEHHCKFVYIQNSSIL